MSPLLLLLLLFLPLLLSLFFNREPLKLFELLPCINNSNTFCLQDVNNRVYPAAVCFLVTLFFCLFSSSLLLLLLPLSFSTITSNAFPQPNINSCDSNCSSNELICFFKFFISNFKASFSITIFSIALLTAMLIS